MSWKSTLTTVDSTLLQLSPSQPSHSAPWSLSTAPWPTCSVPGSSSKTTCLEQRHSRARALNYRYMYAEGRKKDTTMLACFLLSSFSSLIKHVHYKQGVLRAKDTGEHATHATSPPPLPPLRTKRSAQCSCAFWCRC